MGQSKIEQAYAAYEKTKQLNYERKYVDDSVTFSEYSDIYTFTTENIDGYLDFLNVKNKKVLTVTSSGDHLINLALKGAKEIDCFDINRNSYYISELKMAALKALSYEEFLAFFATHVSYNLGIGVCNKFCFNRFIYEKIKQYLSEDVALYFDCLYAKYNDISSERILFSSSINETKKNNTYLKNESAYKEAKRKIINIKYSYCFCDIYQLHKLSKKYDVILLSNIYDYLIKPNNENYKTRFVNYIKNDLKDLLTDEGLVALAYQYFYRKFSLSLGSVEKSLKDNYVIEKRTEFDNQQFIKLEIPGARTSLYCNSNDCVYVYKKG